MRRILLSMACFGLVLGLVFSRTAAPGVVQIDDKEGQSIQGGVSCDWWYFYDYYCDFTGDATEYFCPGSGQWAPCEVVQFISTYDDGFATQGQKGFHTPGDPGVQCMVCGGTQCGDQWNSVTVSTCYGN